MKRFVYLAIFVAAGWACKGPEVGNSKVTELSEALEQLLGDSLNTYVLPASNDYNAIPQDPNNPLYDAKVELGKLLFHETAFSLNTKTPRAAGTFSCATCHVSVAGFQSGLRQSIGEGGVGFGIAGEGRVADATYVVDSLDVLPLKAPSVLNVAFQENMLWSGSLGARGKNIGTEHRWGAASGAVFNHLGFSGVETQVRAAFKGHRFLFVDSLLEKYNYKPLFDKAFPDVPVEERYSTITYSLAIAAFERTVLANKAPFQQWLKGDKSAMSEAELRGAILFFDKAQCSKCHFGPALNAMEFYALGFNDLQGEEIFFVDTSLVDAVHTANLGRGGFTLLKEDYYKFKVPQLYNLKDARFFGHGASFYSLYDLVSYLNKGEPENPDVDVNNLAEEFKPLGLTEEEINDIVAFLENALYDPDLQRYVPSSVPSGNCIPNNDPQSRIDLGCN